MIRITWDDVRARFEQMRIDRPDVLVYGVPKGGMCACAALTRARLVAEPEQADLIVDDVIDTGRTARRYRERFPDTSFAALFQVGPGTQFEGKWLAFPWEEHEAPAEDAVVRLLQSVGEDPRRPGLYDTPRRVVGALREMCSGYGVDVAAVLGTSFDGESYNGPIVVRKIPFVSLCEHHMLPFVGAATVGYWPGDAGRVVGLSKIPRIVQAFARRLQIQERLTSQIAASLYHALEAEAAGCVIESEHSCLSCRGARVSGAAMVTEHFECRTESGESWFREFRELVRTGAR